MKTLLAAAIAAAAILAALLIFKRADDPSGAHATAAASAQLPASSVLRISPRDASPRPPSAGTQPAPAPAAVPPEVAQLRSRAGWATLKERVASAPSTGATLYVQAEIYNRCAKRPPRPGAPQSRQEARQRFAASIEGQPDTSLRLAAYDKNNADLCEGIAPEDFNDAKLDAMIAAAAQAGDARAQAWQLARAVEADYRERSRAGPSGLAISDEQAETIRRTLASRDPGVVREYQGILSSSLADGTWRIPGIEGRIDQRALNAALALVGCDLGDACGSDSRDLLNACAVNGYCGASNLYDHTYFYEASPNSAQLMERYRQALVQAINSGDLAGLRIVREPTNNSRQMIFTGRRGP